MKKMFILCVLTMLLTSCLFNKKLYRSGHHFNRTSKFKSGVVDNKDKIKKNQSTDLVVIPPKYTEQDNVLAETAKLKQADSVSIESENDFSIESIVEVQSAKDTQLVQNIRIKQNKLIASHNVDLSESDETLVVSDIQNNSEVSTEEYNRFDFIKRNGLISKINSFLSERFKLNNQISDESVLSFFQFITTFVLFGWALIAVYKITSSNKN